MKEEKKKINVNGEWILFVAGYKGRREKVLYFVWPKMIVVKMWVPKYGPIAQCFKHVGTLIPRYTIIKCHFLTLGKIIYQK